MNSRLLSICLVSAVVAMAAPSVCLGQQPPMGDAAAEAPPIPDHAGVRSVLASNPTTPPDLFRAIYLLVQFGHGELAKPLAKKLTDANPTPQVSQQILRRYGPAAILRVATDEKLAPEGAAVTDLLLKAAEQYRSDPARLKQAINDLGSTNTATASEAVRTVAEAGPPGVIALVDALANPPAGANAAAVRQALAGLVDDTPDAVIAALDSTDDRQRTELVRVMQLVRSRRGALRLTTILLDRNSNQQLRREAAIALRTRVSEALSRSQVVDRLRHEIKRFNSGVAQLTTDADNRATIWYWDAAKKTLARGAFPHDDALKVIAASYARDLLRLDNANASSRRLAWLTTLSAAKILGEMDKPLPDGFNPLATGQKPSVAELSSALTAALQQDNAPAAIGLAEMLGQSGDVAALAGSGGNPAPLVKAAWHNQIRVRLAAVSAVMRIKPTQSFAGACYVSKSMNQFASSRGARRAIIVDTRIQRARTLAGLIGELGIKGEAVSLGRIAMRRAAESPDVELMLIDLSVVQPTVLFLLEDLKNDPRTARIPIGLISLPEHDLRARTLAARYPNVMVISGALDPVATSGAVERLLRLRGPHALSAEQRGSIATTALGWMAQVAASPMASAYDADQWEATLRRSLMIGSQSASAAAALEHISTGTAQQALADLVLARSQPRDSRTTAARRLAGSIDRFGLLITPSNVDQLYDSFNSAPVDDSVTRSALDVVLDSIERKFPVAKSPAPAKPASADPALEK